MNVSFLIFTVQTASFYVSFQYVLNFESLSVVNGGLQVGTDSVHWSIWSGGASHGERIYQPITLSGSHVANLLTSIKYCFHCHTAYASNGKWAPSTPFLYFEVLKQHTMTIHYNFRYF